MTDPSGYPAQQPGPAFGPGYPEADSRRPNGATAILAGIAGLVLAGLVGYVPISFFINIESGFSIGDLPARTLIYLGVFFAAALFLLIGALITFVRATAGAVLLLLGSLLAIAAILLEPVLISDGDYGSYFKVVFTLENFELTVRAATIVLAPLVLILAALPPTFTYLRYRTSAPQVYNPAQPSPPQTW